MLEEWPLETNFLTFRMPYEKYFHDMIRTVFVRNFATSPFESIPIRVLGRCTVPCIT